MIKRFYCMHWHKNGKLTIYFHRSESHQHKWHINWLFAHSLDLIDWFFLIKFFDHCSNEKPIDFELKSYSTIWLSDHSIVMFGIDCFVLEWQRLLYQQMANYSLKWNNIIMKLSMNIDNCSIQFHLALMWADCKNLIFGC